MMDELTRLREYAFRLRDACLLRQGFLLRFHLRFHLR